MTNNQGWQWWVGRDEEVFTYGPMETRDEAIQVGKSDLNGEFFLVEARQDNIALSSWFDASQWLERLDETLYDNDLGGSEGDSNLDHITIAEQGDLQAMVRATIALWQAQHGIVVKPWHFTAQRNEEFFHNGED